MEYGMEILQFVVSGIFFVSVKDFFIAGTAFRTGSFV
jgi:hypothetical protein